MKHHGHLVITDLTTNGPADVLAMGAGVREFRLTFANAATFPSVDVHRETLHRDASDHAQMLHHQHSDIMLEDLRETTHDGHPAFILKMRREP
jgi:hypothetical protein